MASFLDSQLKSYGVETKLVELGQQIIEGQRLELPPAILGRIGTDSSKKTVLIYGHFDVQPVSNPGFQLSSDELSEIFCYLSRFYCGDFRPPRSAAR